MEIINFRVFKGRNIYSHNKCIRINLDIKGYRDIPIKEIFDFNINLLQMIPELTNETYFNDEASIITKNLAEETYFVHIIEHIIIEIHNRIGVEISCGRSKEISKNIYYVIYQYEYRNTGLQAANIAVDIVNSLITKKLFHLDTRLNRLKEILINEQLGVSIFNICNEAKKEEFLY